MYKTRPFIIRLLAIFSILIFFLPFFQACDDETLRDNSSFIKGYTSAKTDGEKEIVIKDAKDSFTLTGYDLAFMVEYESAAFSLMMVVNIVILVCVLRKMYKLLSICFLNIAAIIFALIMLTIYSSLGQFRFGFFLYLINFIILSILIYQENETASNR
jgi:hypothetical protein